MRIAVARRAGIRPFSGLNDNMSAPLPEVYLRPARRDGVDHQSRQHTGRTDLPLTSRGEDNAWGLHDRLRGLAFDRVFVSPLRRARQTCLLAGFAERAVTVAELTEWDYGDVRGPHDGPGPQRAAALVAVPRRLPGGRVGRGRRRPR